MNFLRVALSGLILRASSWLGNFFLETDAMAVLAGTCLLTELVLLLTPAEVARRVGVSISLIYQLCAERRLPHYRIGGDGRRGKLLIDEADLEAFLSACRVDADGLDESEPLRHIR